MVKVSARFLHAGTGLPLAQPHIEARLYDHDPISDDLLAEAVLDGSGEAHWLFDLSRVRSKDSPLESKPDLYVELSKEGKVFFQSPVLHNVNFVSPDEVTGENPARTQELDTFHVDFPVKRST